MRLLIALILALSAKAAVVEGVVLDEETGNPLARTLVTLVPLPGTPAGNTSVKTTDKGSFVVLNVRPGWYVIRATRRGYIAAESGQLRPGRPGKAFEIAGQERFDFIKIVMTRLAAITGTILDSNGIGLPDWPVHVYTARKPVRHIGQTITDDRGNFRLAELEAGSYVVRSAAGVLDDDTTLLATYFKYGTDLENAEAIRLHPGETQGYAVIRPVAGKLWNVSGTLTPAPGKPAPPATLTFITDTGRREILTATEVTRFRIPLVSPGAAELFVEGKDLNGRICGSYLRIMVAYDMSDVSAACTPATALAVEWRMEDGSRVDVTPPLLMRRADLDGAGPVRIYRPDEVVLPGNWELNVPASAKYYATSISNSGSKPVPRVEDWVAVRVSNYARVQIVLSAKPAVVSGIVKLSASSSSPPVSGAPVFLEMFNPDQGQRLQMWSGRADERGRWKFEGLAPGNYRAISGFDIDTEEPSAFRNGRSVTVAQGAVADLPITLTLP